MYDLGTILILAFVIPLIVFLWAGVLVVVKLAIEFWRDKK
jgi:hypothetical protein